MPGLSIRTTAPALVAAAMLLSACTAAGDNTTTTRSPDPITSAAPSAPTPDTTPAPPDTTVRTSRATTTTTMPDPLVESVLAQYGEFGPDLPIGSSGGQYSGSGCTVGGDNLPDGVWFGHILEYEISAEPGLVDFDLACVEAQGSQSIVTNETPRIRRVLVTGDTRFVFVRDQEVLSPGTDASAISNRLGEQFDAGWGWGLVEDGNLAEFYVPDKWDWQNRTNHARESSIPRTLYPDPTTDEVLTAPDGFDGSGCTPEGNSLGDGLWFGKPRFTGTNQLYLDLWCSVSEFEQMVKVGIDPEFVEDRTAIDDGSAAEFELAIADDALLYMTFFDGNFFQTPLTLDDPRYVHMVRGPQPAFEEWTPGLWVKVEDGDIVEGYNFFSP